MLYNMNIILLINQLIIIMLTPNERLKQYFQEKNITQAEIAEQYGSSQANISKLLNNPNMELSVINKFSDLYNLSVIWILSGEGSVHKKETDIIIEEPQHIYKTKPKKMENLTFEELFFQLKIEKEVSADLNNHVLDLNRENQILKQQLKFIREICLKCETCKKPLKMGKSKIRSVEITDQDLKADNVHLRQTIVSLLSYIKQLKRENQHLKNEKLTAFWRN